MSKSPTIQLRVPADLLLRLQTLAIQKGSTTSQIVREALLDYFRKNNDRI